MVICRGNALLDVGGRYNFLSQPRKVLQIISVRCVHLSINYWVRLCPQNDVYVSFFGCKQLETLEFEDPGKNSTKKESAFACPLQLCAGVRVCHTSGFIG
jgi:hypothetical protein